TPVLHQALDDLNALMTGMGQHLIMLSPLDRLPTPGNRHFHRARTHLRHTLSGIIADRRERGIDRGDLLSALLTARDTDTDDTRQRLSDAEICDQIVAFFIGGAEAKIRRTSCRERRGSAGGEGCMEEKKLRR